MTARDEKLMRLLDGELVGAEADATRAEVDASPEGRAEEQATRALGDALRGHFAVAADEAQPDLDRLWRRLERKVAEEALQPTGFFARVAAFLSLRRGYFATAMASGLAGALLFALVWPHQQVALDTSRVEMAEPAAPPVVAARGAEVESLEVSGGTGMVLQIPGANAGEAATTVIWVTHDENEGPI